MSYDFKSIGDVPYNLPAHHRNFLARMKENLEILIGAQQSQDDAESTPQSQAVTFGDLVGIGLDAENDSNTEDNALLCSFFTA